MELGTIIGMVVGGVLLAWAILSGGDLWTFVDIPSFVLVLGGTIGATMVTFPLSQLISIPKIVKNAFFEKRTDPYQLIEQIVSWARTARQKGLLALEEQMRSINDAFLREGLKLITEGTDAEVVAEMLHNKIEFIRQRHTVGFKIFRRMGEYAPAFGMIGTLVGLVQMLAHLDDPDKIGPGMALALITTLYGSLMANIIFIPIAGKLQAKSDEELFYKRLAAEGLLSILDGQNPMVVEQKLLGCLSPREREKYQQRRSGK